MTHANGQTLSRELLSNIWLARLCSRHGIMQNPGKFVFGSITMNFAGFVITPTAIQPRDKRVRAIREFPHHKTSLTSDLGSASSTQRCAASSTLRNDMTPSHERLKPSSTYYCDGQLQLFVEQYKVATLDKINVVSWVSGYSTPNVLHSS